MQDNSINILVSGLMLSKDILKEHEQLDRLLFAVKDSHLMQSNFRHRVDSDDLESDFLANAASDNVETSVIPKDLLTNQTNLKNLVSYAFERRFGWSEQESSQQNERKSKQSDLSNPSSGGSPYHRLRTGSLPYAEETRTKAMLNCKLDELINLLVMCNFFHSFLQNGSLWLYQLFILHFSIQMVGKKSLFQKPSALLVIQLKLRKIVLYFQNCFCS